MNSAIKRFRLASFFALACLTAAIALATDARPAAAAISNGANAVDMLGQYDADNLASVEPDYDKGGYYGQPDRFSIYPVSGGHTVIDSANDRLFLSDANHNRVLVFNLNPDDTLIDYIPDYVLGQPDFDSDIGSATSTVLDNPQGMAIDVSRSLLFVADSDNSRVMVFDVSSVSNGQAAVNVLGQSDFTSSSGSVTQNGMSMPNDVAYDSSGIRLFVADGNNRRVLVYDVSSISDGQAAANVLGQPDFTSNSSNATQTGMKNPMGVAFDGNNNRLFVSDYINNRVLEFNTSSLSNGQAAAHVLGQTSFTAWSAATTQAGLRYPRGLAVDVTNQKLFVVDGGNHRVIVHNISSVSNGQNAANVLGQADYVTQTSATSQSRLNGPIKAGFDAANSFLYVSDSAARRILVFDVTAIGNGENAVDLIGQYDANQPYGTLVIDFDRDYLNHAMNRLGYDSPYGSVVDSTNHYLYVSDESACRIMVYALDSGNVLIDRVPDYVLGQADFNGMGYATTATGLKQPMGMAVDEAGQRLFVADYNNHRVLVYDVSSMSNGQAAANVLGQPNFTSSSGATTQSGMYRPADVAYDATGQRLFVADRANNRVLVFDVSSLSDGQAADNVLGQPNFTSSSSATTQAGLYYPSGLAYDAAGQRLFVSAEMNNRVTVFDVSSLSDGQAADNVLGQPDFTTATSGTTASKLNGPHMMDYDAVHDRLFVADMNNDRVIVYDTAAVANGENAVNVLGQPDFTSNSASLSRSGMDGPVGLAYDPLNDILYVNDQYHYRIPAYDVSPAAVSVGGGRSCGNPAVTVSSPNGGETLAAGQEAWIFWSVGGCYQGTPKISLSKDGGKSYPTEITSGSGAVAGAYRWRVPDDIVSTTTARIKVEMQLGSTAVFDVSDSDFSIIGQEPADSGAGDGDQDPIGDGSSATGGDSGAGAADSSGSGDADSPQEGGSSGTAIQMDINEDKDLPTAAGTEAEEQQSACGPSRLVKLADSDAVYFCGRDGQRYVFPNRRIYESWFMDFSGVATVSADFMAAMPLGGNVTYRPGIRLVKVETDPKVYAVERGGLLRWVPTEELAAELYGEDWNTQIDDVPAAFFVDYTIGEPLAADE